MAAELLFLDSGTEGRAMSKEDFEMRKAVAQRFLVAVVVLVLLALGQLACGGGSKSPTAPVTFGTPTPMAVATPTPRSGY
jgi:hypothetical protein